MVKNKMHNNINDNHIIIIQYSLSLVLSFSFTAFTPLIIAKFATNAHIFSPLNISFITINIIITEIIAITMLCNVKQINIQIVIERKKTVICSTYFPASSYLVYCL